eukprot:6177879-Pleurochrysis_carterae.AAC.2
MLISTCAHTRHGSQIKAETCDFHFYGVDRRKLNGTPLEFELDGRCAFSADKRSHRSFPYLYLALDRRDNCSPTRFFFAFVRNAWS